MRIDLDANELQYVNGVAEKRHRAFENTGVTPHKMKRAPLDRDIIGCKAEYAVAKYLGVEWEPNVWHTWDDYRNKKLFRDVAGSIEVRGTPYLSGRLPVKSVDPDGVPFVLVIVGGSMCDLLGWKFSQDCKQEKYIEDYGYNLSWVSYFVPRRDLEPMSTLRVK